METLARFVLRPDHVIYLANLAAVVSVICAMGLLAAWACRRCSTPLRHGILIAVLALTLSCPISVWLGQQKGLALIRVGVTLSGPAGQPDFSSALPPQSNSPSGSILSSRSGHGAQGPGTASPSQLSGVDSSMRPAVGLAKGETASSDASTEDKGQAPLPSPYRVTQSFWWQAIGTFAAWAWAIGILVGVLRLGLGYVALMRICRSFRQLLDPRVTKLQRQAADYMGLREAPPMFISPLVPIPISLGLVRPAIVLPTDITLRMDDAQLQAILVHEMAHICRLDPWVGLAQRIAVVVFWWNPLVHKVSDQVSRLREDLCDNYVVLVQGNGEDFARTLVDVASQMTAHPVLPATVGVLEPNLDGLTERIHRLVEKERDMATRMSIGSMLLVLTCALTILFGTGLIRCLQAAEVAPATSAGARTDKDGTKPPTTPVGADDVVDPNTRLRFVVSKTIAGTNDVIEDEDWITLSPNGRFLLWYGRVVPLDGSPAFTLMELLGAHVDTWSATWSPDGRKIAFNADGIEVLPVLPETGRPTGPARKLLQEEGEWFRGKIYWSTDSERILFMKYNRQWEREIGTVSLRDGRLDRQPDYADFGLVSPNGKTIAYSMPDDGIWAKPLAGGPARIARSRSGGWLSDDPAAWTSDCQWVVSAVNVWHREEIHFARLSDGQTFDVFPPDAVGPFIGRSTDGSKLYFYRSSFDHRTTVKAVPISGGPVLDTAPSAGFSDVWDQSWTPDSASLVVIDDGDEGQQLWWIPLRGGERVPFDLKSFGQDRPWLWSLSPDASMAFYDVKGTKGDDLRVVPISLKKGRATGPATLVFEGWQCPHPNIAQQWGTWSPDGSKIAMPHKGDQGCELWILFADGDKPVRITQTPYELGPCPQWSPDGKMIAFRLIAPDREIVQVIPTEGGTTRTILATPREQSPLLAWSPDSREVAVAYDGAITGFPVSGGGARVIVKLQDTGCESTSWLGWSPDGQHLAFHGGKRGESSRLCLFSPGTGKIATPNNTPNGAWAFTWSPDSRMISCTVEEAIKTRPVGVIRELDVAEAVQKAPPVTERKPTVAANAPQAEPITGPVFSDNFDDGPSRHWRFQDLPENGLGPGRHAVENGELMLSHSRAILDVPDWTDYIVTVRVCMKEVAASGNGNLGIEVRAVPSQFGSSRMDRYGLGVHWTDGASPYLWMGINYADVSDTLRHGMLGHSPCSIVRDKWYTLEFEVRGQQLRGYLDGKLMVEATDARLSKGILWIGTSRSRALFDDVSVRQLP